VTRLLRLFALLLAVLSLGAAEPARVLRPFSQQAAEWGQQLSRLRAEIARPNLTLAEIDHVGRELDELRQQAGAVRDEERQKSDSTKGLLGALGPSPEAGAAPEPPDIAAKRNELNADFAATSGRVKQAELVVLQAEELQRGLAQVRADFFTAAVLARGPSPLSPAVWAEAVPELGQAVVRLGDATAARWRTAGESVAAGQRLRDLLLAGAALLFALVVGWRLRRTLIARFGRDPGLPAPELGRRVLAAAAGGTARGLISALAISAVSAVLIAGQPGSLFAALVQALSLATVSVILFITLAWAALAPAEPAWRILPVDNHAASAIYHRVVLAMAIAAVHIVFFDIADAIQASAALRAVLPALVDTALALVLLSLLPSRLWRDARVTLPSADQTLPESADAAHLSADAVPPGASTGLTTASVAAPETAPALGGRWWLIVRVLAGLVALSVPFWAIFGYTRLATYLNTVLIQSAAAIAFFLLLRLLASEALAALIGRTDAPDATDATPAPTPEQPRFRRWLALSDQSARYLEFWLLLAADVALIIGGLVVAALILGTRASDLMSGIAAAFAGFTIGKIRFAPIDIGLGILLFAVVLGITRLVQRFLDERVLKRTRVDAGVRNSLISGIGYVGFFLAAVTAISTAGVDLSNLAIVAGALSVGIGFGLQNIVNNFVSGLILLVERPIKVGDVVSVNNREGQVKRISVRATEIETAKRASIIIPNSEILSSAVTNMTHRDAVSRVEIILGVAYGSDTAKVRDTLLACTEGDYRILRHPAPQVLFRNFGDSALEFELRCFVGTLGDTLWVPSDLRFAIDKAFREKGIEMPFPQREVRIKDLDRLIDRLPAAEASPPPAKPAGS
jgi:potassium-dependent mechanosensitive channel